MAFIKARDLKHKFERRDDSGEITDTIMALDGVDIDVEKGDFVAILGANGSGKSTFARHLNVLLYPSSGALWIGGRDALDEENTWQIRQSAGMIFQNPDNQIVASVVEEDVAFGPENIGVPTKEIWERVSKSLEAVNMEAWRQHSPDKLSGGQKQKVAIASVLAMQPECIIMDEPTAMLDPTGRADVIKAARALNREKGITIILITHYMEEAAGADRVFVMDKGRIAMQGSAREIFSRSADLKALGLSLPQITYLADELRDAGMDIPEGILDRQELLEAICRSKLRA